jgi:CHAD domain-containing protein
MSADPRSLLDLPAREAIGHIAGNYLAAAAKGLRRLQDPEDPKGLHAFRVAVRRLRSLLRAFKPWAGRVAGRKVRRKLRKLTRETNAARDAEVHLAWLIARTKSLSSSERPGGNWATRRLRERKRRARRVAGKNLGAVLSDVAKRIRERLAEAEEVEPGTYRIVLAGLVEQGAARARKRIAAIADADDEEGIHRSRIAVKRLRYLIEPLRKEIPEARAAVRAVRKLQDLLGELHDRHVLEDELARDVEDAATEKARDLHALAVSGKREKLAREQRRDERVGLLALAARARVERDRLHAKLRQEWRIRAARLFEGEIDALRRALTPPS